MVKLGKRCYNNTKHTFSFFGNSFIFKLHNNYTQNVFLGGDIISGDMLQFKNWLFGIIGGIIAGFQLLIIWPLSS